jgi:hypothetical protein
MNDHRAILEYCITDADGGREAQWGFKFKGPGGQVLIESAKAFNSQAEAEEGFVSALKLIATNQYVVHSASLPKALVGV